MSANKGNTPMDENQALTQNVAEPQAKENEQEAKLGLSMLAKVALGVMVLVSLIISISCLMQFNRLEVERKELEAELAEYNEAIRELQEIINSPMDDEYIIQQAKDKLGYYFPDENIYYQD
ncbi:MAG: septum formation initiator family protein [Clostridia bacterium]|nr:septum formation initiator family protein [Clostridia bacterium]